MERGHRMEPVGTLIDLYHQVHHDIRQEIQDLDTAVLNMTLGPRTSSIAVLVGHLLGSEAEVLTIVHSGQSDRDRDAEFLARAVPIADLLGRLDAADSLLDAQGAAITLEDLAGTRPRPNHRPQTGLYWLLSNYGHAREHLAQIQLTRQLLAQRP